MIKSNLLIEDFKSKKNSFAEDFAIRIHRSLSWLKRSETETNDIDAKFIFLWISFNANYSGLEGFSEKSYAQNIFNKFFEVLIENDKDRYIYDYIWKKFNTSIKSVLTNEYLLSSYWKFHKSNPKLWIEIYEKEKKIVTKALSDSNSLSILNIMFDRLYVLRNQIFHGNATWNSKVNRKQLEQCTGLLSEIIPIFVIIMIENPKVNWGELIVPVLSS